MGKLIIDPQDKRWGGYVPWFFRHGDFTVTGNLLLFFERVSQRLYRLFFHNESVIQNLNHFGAIIESRSLQRYRFKWEYTQGDASLANSIQNFFDPNTLRNEMGLSLREDAEYKTILNRGNEITAMRWGSPRAPRTDPNGKFTKAYSEYQKLVATRTPILEQKYYQPLFIQRLGVLEVILTSLQKDNKWVVDLVVDVRRFFAEAQVMLDIETDSYEIRLLEEPLLQKEVLDTLLPRLSSHYPDRAKEFVKAYHDMIAGEDFDEVFVSAFKTLEELARSITKYNKFEFKENDLKKHFPNLHPTIHSTIIKLNAHRGDEAGHAKKAPDPHEMRYLLFSVMNIALLLLDYQP
jgi:hypothetical protein